MEEQMLRATIQSILGSLPLHSPASAQGSSTSTPSSRVLFLATVTGKESNTWEVTLPKKKLCWGSARPGSAQVEYAKRSRGTHRKEFLPAPPQLTSDPPAGKSVCARVCVYTLAGKGFRTVNCTLDLIQHTQHQATALLELTLYRAGQSEAQFPPFALKPSRAGGYSPQLAARLAEGESAAKPQLAAQARVVPSSVCKAAHGSARPGELCDQGKWLQAKMQTEQICFLFLYVSYHRRTHSRLLSH